MQVKQKWGLSLEKNFQPTSNARNEAMFREATKFSLLLKQFERDLKLWQKDVQGTFQHLRTILLAPLPRVYTLDEVGGAIPDENEPVPIGMNVQTDRIKDASEDLKARLDKEVIAPIKQWMQAYKTIQEHMARVEEMRLVLDSRRRTVRTLDGKILRLKSSTQTTTKTEKDAKLVEEKKVHKQEKASKDETEYAQKEKAVYTSLFTLIQDTSVLRDYAAAALAIMQDCFVKAYAAFEHPGNEYTSYSSNAGVPSASDNKYETAGETSQALPKAASFRPALAQSLAPKGRINKYLAEDLPGDAAGRPFDQKTFHAYKGPQESEEYEPAAQYQQPGTQYNNDLYQHRLMDKFADGAAQPTAAGFAPGYASSKRY